MILFVIGILVTFGLLLIVLLINDVIFSEHEFLGGTTMFVSICMILSAFILFLYSVSLDSDTRSIMSNIEKTRYIELIDSNTVLPATFKVQIDNYNNKLKELQYKNKTSAMYENFIVDEIDTVQPIKLKVKNFK